MDIHNSLDVFPNGDVPLSSAFKYCSKDQQSTGKVIWRWGPEQLLGHQHSVSVLDSGNMLIFDNGLHRNPPLVTDEATQGDQRSRIIKSSRSQP